MKSRTQVEIENLKQRVRERERESRVVKWSVLTMISILTGAGLQGYKKT